MKEKESREGWNLPIESTGGQFETEELKLGSWTSDSLLSDPKHMFETVDISVDTLLGKYDGIFNIDVIEHLEPEYEKPFVENMVQCLSQQGVMFIGVPNDATSQYATFCGDHQHINLKTADSLKSLIDNYFHNTFVFSMNDEMIYVGYFPMAHYLFAMGVGKN
jgi:hypothetical protein